MKKLIISLVVLLVVAVIAIKVLPYQGWKGDAAGSDQSGTPSGGAEPVMMSTTTVVGTFACLPHKGDGPHTMECAYGMKGENGSFYALDWSATPVSAFDLPMDRKYSVTGLYVPVEMLSSDHWKAYDIKGIIKVSEYTEIASDIPAMNVPVTATLELKKPVTFFRDTTIRVAAVIEDSRCPSDVQCIQAGRARVAVSIESPSGQTSAIMESGQTVTTETLSITLDKVTPYPVSTNKTADGQYRFTFTVKNK